MNKRKINDITYDKNKTRKLLDEISVSKYILIRNDDNPSVLVNIDCSYLKIGNYVYKTEPFNQTWMDCNHYLDDKIALNLTQYNDIKKYIFTNKILVTAFGKDVNYIDNLSINLTIKSNIRIVANKNDIVSCILDKLKYHIVSLGQLYSIIYKDIPMDISIENIDGKSIGKVDRKTLINLKFFDDNIIIYNKVVTINKNDVRVYVNKCIDLNMVDDTPDILPKKQDIISRFPLILDKNTINLYFLKTIKGSFIDNDEFIYRNNDFEFTFIINVIGINKKTRYKTMYKFALDDEKIDIQSNVKDVIIIENTMNANKIYFICTPPYQQIYNIDDYIIFVEDVLNDIRKKIKSITLEQIYKYINQSKEINFKINDISPKMNEKTMYNLVYKSDDNNDNVDNVDKVNNVDNVDNALLNTNIPSPTKIRFSATNQSKFIFVKNKIPLEIDEITFKIKTTIGSLFGFPITENKSKIFDSNKMEKKIREVCYNRTAIHHQTTIHYMGDEYTIVVTEILFKNKEIGKNGMENSKMKKNHNKYFTYGLITSDSRIKFKLSKKDKTSIINTNKNDELLKQPLEELGKHVGGLTQQLEKIIRTICLARGKLKEEFIERGLKHERGIILHGPPGTGKTTIARNLGKIIGCEGERFRLMSGPEIFNKYVGQSEKNVREIFKPAEDAWKKYGIDSPIYMIVIDEIDAMIPARDGDSSHRVSSSVVNQFLAKLDGLEQFENFICIGITNRIELLDPAAIRPGRLGTHIKIDLPDKSDRIKIFEIHTKKLVESNKMLNINFNKLSELTDKFSGADIEGVVKIASMMSLERLNKMEDINKEIIEKHGKITQDDFIKAINEITSINKDPAQVSLSPMYG